MGNSRAHLRNQSGIRQPLPLRRVARLYARCPNSRLPANRGTRLPRGSSSRNSFNFPRCQYPAPRADAARETGRRAHPQAAFRAAQRTRRRQRRFHLPCSGVSHSARYSISLPQTRQQRVVRPLRVCGHVSREWRQPSNHASRRIILRSPSPRAAQACIRARMRSSCRGTPNR